MILSLSILSLTLVEVNLGLTSPYNSVLLCKIQSGLQIRFAGEWFAFCVMVSTILLSMSVSFKQFFTALTKFWPSTVVTLDRPV